ncbi:hypothetical protein [Dyadobacter sp. CY312]|uniref:hypothetical protein n=1 Tax=Dyadobacter sp. CY312 TaxID=2907303 RepID=UPI001F2EEA5D|nr:hypothetical protein [Dyadobacter sp. CY312]MCE7040831.1 hypothetical protein [Dyadobacter sp. CY312]
MNIQKIAINGKVIAAATIAATAIIAATIDLKKKSKILFIKKYGGSATIRFE